jgi:hypothetical protein
MGKRRKTTPVSTRVLVLHEAGYRCANPACRTPLTLDIHHLEYVSRGGTDDPANLLPLCPNCHALHHRGAIPLESVRAWKLFLLTLNQAFDRGCIDLLLALDKTGQVAITSDGLLFQCGSLVASSLVEFKPLDHHTFWVNLSPKGRLFVEGWRRGDQRTALGAGGIDEGPATGSSGASEPQGRRARESGSPSGKGGV